MFGLKKQLDNKHLQIKLVKNGTIEELNWKPKEPKLSPVEVAAMTNLLVRDTAFLVAGLMILKTVCKIAEKRFS
jgi:hypothetical protein